MASLRTARRYLLAGATAIFLTGAPAAQPPPRPGTPPARPATQPQAKPAPRLEAVADTKLLMEGLNQSNLRGLEKLLKERPADVETWAFLRGQALLVAETGNLLMLRPPRNQGQT